MSDPTSIDAVYQIRNLPPFGGGQFSGINPPVGPFGGSPLVIDQSTGAVLSAGPTLSWLLASLTNPGMVSDAGGQQLHGPFFFTPIGGASAPPTLPVFPWSIVLQDGSLILTQDLDGSPPSPFAELTWERFSAIQHTLTLGSGGGLILQAGSEPTATCTMVGPISGQLITQDQPPNYTQLVDPVQIGLFGGPSAFALLTGNSMLNTCWLDLRSETAGQVWYQISGVPGVGGTFAGGLTVQGGIVTGIGAPSLPWADLTGTPTTLGGYGISDGIGTGTALGADLSGFLPNPLIAELQGQPLTLAAPALHDVLQWSGAAWVQGPVPASLAIGEAVAGGTAGRVLFEGSGPVLADDVGLTYDPAMTGLHVSVAGFTCNLASGTAGTFLDSARIALLCDSAWAVNAVAGSIHAIGTVGNTYDWANPDTAPSTQSPVSLPLQTYGGAALVGVLGTPDAWVMISIGGTPYRVPAYL